MVSEDGTDLKAEAKFYRQLCFVGCFHALVYLIRSALEEEAVAGIVCVIFIMVKENEIDNPEHDH